MKPRPSVFILVSATALVVLLAGIAFGGVPSDGDAVAPGSEAAGEQPVAAAQITTTTSTTTTVAPVTTVPRSTTTTTSTTTTVAPVTTTVPRTTTTVPQTTTVPRTTTTAAPATTTTKAAPASTTTTTTAPVRVAGYDGSAESRLVSLVNGVRSSAGLPALSSVGELHSYARGWAKHMGETDSLGHSNLNNVPGPWQSVGENVGFGPTVDSVFDRLVASSGHYANMINSTYTDIGVGVWVDTDGTFWVSQVFRG